MRVLPMQAERSIMYANPKVSLFGAIIRFAGSKYGSRGSGHVAESDQGLLLVY
jgi:hypothetical protein